jgi:DNA-binding protein
MIVWLTMWTVGCVFLARAVIVGREPFLLLFGVPFWASWFFVFFMLLKAFFQVEEVVLDAEGLRFRRRVIVAIKSRQVPTVELKKVTRYSTVVDSESGRRAEGLELETSGQPLRLFQGLGGDELQWLAYQINEGIAGLPGRAADVKELAAAPMAAGEAPASGAEAAGADPDDASLLILSAGPAAVPTDSQWRVSERAEDLVFAWRGRFRLGQIAGALFMCLFWNGIVSVFVMGLFGWAPRMGNGMPQGAGWWGMFLFLIPFEAVGVSILWGLLYMLGEPFHRLRWTFSANGVERRNTWLGVGLRRTWPVTRLGRLELRRESAGQKRFWKFRIAEQMEETTYAVVLITPESCELCAIKGLTQGEARWMAQSILRQGAGWFG